MSRSASWPILRTPFGERRARLPRLGIFEGVLAETLERLGEPGREAVEQLALARGGVAISEPIERGALCVEQLLELLAQLAEGAPQVHLTVPAPHLLAQPVEE